MKMIKLTEKIGYAVCETDIEATFLKAAEIF